MATYYVYHGGSGAGGTSWATAYTTLTTAFSGHAAGDTYYVAHDHLESTAGLVTLTSLGTLAAPTNVICVNRAGSVPPVSADLRTTAIVATSAANSVNIGAGSTYWYGITFRAGTTTSSAPVTVISTGSNQYVRFDSCGFTVNNTNAASRINLSNSASALGNQLICRNCTFTFGSNVSQSFASVGSLTTTIIGGSVVVGANVPTTLFSALPTNLYLIGVDLSAIGSGKTLFAASANNFMTLVQDCKLGSGVTIAALPTTPLQTTYLVRSDSGDTNYRQEKHDSSGSLTTETTIVRTGGASDGTTPIAWKIVTGTSVKWIQTFECPPRVIWNDTTGSRTVTIYGVWGDGAVPLNDEIWFEVAYLGTSGFPLASVATTTKADILATGSNTTSDSSTWGGSTTKFKMTSTFTVNEKGPFLVIIKAAKVSSTFYIDPKIEVT